MPPDSARHGCGASRAWNESHRELRKLKPGAGRSDTPVGGCSNFQSRTDAGAMEADACPFAKGVECPRAAMQHPHRMRFCKVARASELEECAAGREAAPAALQGDTWLGWIIEGIGERFIKCVAHPCSHRVAGGRIIEGQRQMIVPPIGGNGLIRRRRLARWGGALPPAPKLVSTKQGGVSEGFCDQ